MWIHPKVLPRRPQGQETRGKTARNRLRRVDNFLAMYDPALLCAEESGYRGAFFVDLGYGAEPFTTLESAYRLRRLNPNLRVLGVEIDPERVRAAVPYADDQTHFRLGGFNLPLHPGETVRVIRAFNVLRQYEEQAVTDAYALLGRSILPGGLLIEGTSDPYGRLWVANLVRREDDGWRQEALVLSTNFRKGFDPSEFQAVLPKNLIHRVIPNEAIYAFFQAWKQAMLETSAQQVWGLRFWFTASIQLLAQRGYTVCQQQKWLGRGFLLWQHPRLDR